MRKWESEKDKSWGCQQKASRATWPVTARCWERPESGELVVGQWHSWTTEAEIEVQRTIKRAELTASFAFLKK